MILSIKFWEELHLCIVLLTSRVHRRQFMCFLTWRCAAPPTWSRRRRRRWCRRPRCGRAPCPGARDSCLKSNKDGWELERMEFMTQPHTNKKEWLQLSLSVLSNPSSHHTIHPHCATYSSCFPCSIHLYLSLPSHPTKLSFYPRAYPSNIKNR